MEKWKVKAAAAGAGLITVAGLVASLDVASAGPMSASSSTTYRYNENVDVLCARGVIGRDAATVAAVNALCARQRQ